MSRCLIAICLAAVFAVPLQAQDEKKTDTAAQDKKVGEKKETPVKTRVLKIESKNRAGEVVAKLPLTIPESWKDVKSASRMRAATVAIPKAEGDKENGELAVFFFPPQSIDDNIKRWVGQFQSTGRKSKVTKGKSMGTKEKPGTEYYLIEVSGTFKKPDGPPMVSKTIDAPGYRMLAAIIPVKGQGVYFLKLTGPDKTIAGQAKAFRKSIDADIKSEKVYSKS